MSLSQFGAAIAALMLLPILASAEEAPGPVEHINGTLVRIEPGQIYVRPSSPRGGTAERAVVVDSEKLKVTRSEMGYGGVKTLAVPFSDLRAGDPVSVKAAGGKAVEINVNSPPAINGLITSVGSDTVTVRLESPSPVRLISDEVFSVDPQRTGVTVAKVQYGPTRKATLADLRPGRPVMILARDHTAYVIHVLPTLPVQGIIRSIDQDRIVLAFPSPGTTRPADHSIRLDGKLTEVFHAYYGEPVEPTTMSDLTAGMVVGVTLEDGVATAITIPHDAMKGTLVDVTPDGVTIELPRGRGAAAVRKSFTLEAGSRLYLGRETGQTKLANGITRRYFVFEPGAHVSDLRVGQSVSVTAKDGRVLSMRITPIPPTTRPSVARP